MSKKISAETTPNPEKISTHPLKICSPTYNQSKIKPQKEVNFVNQIESIISEQGIYQTRQNIHI